MNKKYIKFEEIFKGEILRDELLSRHTSFKIGGPADLMVTARKTGELIEAVDCCQEFSIPFFILGGGTNIVFHDMGFRGVVIKNLCSSYETKGKYVYVESGACLSRFAGAMAEKGWKGLERLAGIPGTVGGAIVGNAGAYGRSIGDVLHSATLFFLNDRSVKEVDREFFDFKYRYSSMKNGQGGNIILSAKLLLEKGNPEELMDIIKKDRYKRRTFHPVEPSAGCIFKNIKVENDTFMEALKNRIPFIPGIVVENKIPAGSIIDKMGLKGTVIGGATISELHGNYIVNRGRARSSDVIALVNLVKNRVKEEIDVELEPEVLFINEYAVAG